jgi:hypothetical protein
LVSPCTKQLGAKSSLTKRAVTAAGRYAIRPTLHQHRLLLTPLPIYSKNLKSEFSAMDKENTQ